MSHCVAFLCLAVLTIPSLAAVQQDGETSRVVAGGTTLSGELAGGETDSYGLQLSVGDFLKVHVEPRGIDLDLVFYAPGGEQLFRVNTPLSAQAKETMRFVASVAGQYRLDVRAVVTDARPGKYDLVVAPITQASANEVLESNAWRAYNEGEQLRGRDTAESRHLAIEAYGRALRQFRELGLKLDQSVVLGRLGMTHNDLSERTQALDYYEQSLALARELGEKHQEAGMLGNIAGIYRTTGDLRKSHDYRLQSLRLLEDIGGEGLGFGLYNVGMVMLDMGRHREALDYFERALPIWQSAAFVQGESHLYHNMATAYGNLGDQQQALDRYLRALELLRKVGDKRGEAQTLVGLAKVYSRLGDKEASIATSAGVLEIWRATGDRFGEAGSLLDYSLTCFDFGETQKAADLAKQALALRKEIGDRVGSASALTVLSRHSLAGGDHAQALEFVEEALRIARDVGNRVSEISALQQLGDVCVAIGQPERALDSFARAASIAEQLSMPLQQAPALLGGGRVKAAAGRLEAALHDFETAADLVEAARSRVALQQLRASYHASRQEYFAELVDTLMQLHRQQPRAGYAARALRVTERSRARQLLDLLVESSADVREGADPTALQRLQSIEADMAAKGQIRNRLLTGKPDATRLAAIDQEIAMLRRDYDSELALIRERSPKYAALTQPQPRDLAAIQREVLDADTVLLEYAMGERRSYLWIVTSDGIETAELPARGEIEALARRVCAQITERNQRLKFESAEQYRGRIAQADAEYAVAAQALSRLVLAPAVGGLAKRRVLVVPDGLLHYVPFAALPAPIVPNGDEPLVASHEVVVLPSATTLAIMRDELASREPQPLMAAVVADPVFEATDARVGKGMAASPRQSEGTAKASALARSLRDVAPATATIERLPFTRREAAAIRQLVPASQRLEALDFAASRTTVTGGVLSKYRIVHFATHGLLDSVHPELSGLVLSLVDEQGRERDGFLRAYEIYNLKLPAELVVLSACRTGLGKDVRGEGIVGLTRGFMYAGAARVIVSLWDVSDEATAELMQRFYSAMLGHKKLSPAAALREAQVSLRRDKRWRSPYYWAAFALQGEPK